MNVLIIDAQKQGLDFAMRCEDAGHTVRLWMPPEHSGEPCCIGQGIVDRPKDWKPSMKWADLIVLTDNSMYRSEIEPYCDGYWPVFGCNAKGAELELDREKGQAVLEEAGIDTADYEIFTSYDDAIDYVARNPQPYVSKPWGGDADKSITYVAKSAEEMIFKLQRWKKEKKLKGQFMLQQVIDGIEMACAGWFGSGGWQPWIEENWEEKKLMNGGLGPNTGEQGTVMRYVKRSKLFNEMLLPLTGYLHEIGYVGDIDMNCIIDKDGKAWPLEFTTRLGWPAFHLQLSLHEGDPARWMRDMLQGYSSLRCSENIGVCVVLTHGDYPHGDETHKHYEGYPIWGINPDRMDDLHFAEVQRGLAPRVVEGRVKEVGQYVTAGDYVLVATGQGRSVLQAADQAYLALDGINGLCNAQYRTDIGERLREELPVLQSFGYAEGMSYV